MTTTKSFTNLVVGGSLAALAAWCYIAYAHKRRSKLKSQHAQSGALSIKMTTTNRLVSLPYEQFLAQLGISSAAPVKEPKVARMKPKVVKATRKLPTRDIPSYDTINYQFGDICRGETVQLKDPNRFGVVLKVVKGRRGAAYTVEIEDGSVLENLSRNSLWKVLKHNVQMIH